MKQQIEEIIKKNLPEKNWRNKWNCHQVGCDWNRNRVYGNKVCDMNCKNVLDNISQINTSLIADEVLKVVVEKIAGERVYCHQDNFLRGCVQCVENHKKNIVVSDIIELLTNSSTLEDERSD